MPSSWASRSQLRQMSLCSRPEASAHQGHAEMPPGPDPASPGDGLGKVPTTPNMPSWGSVFCGNVPWEPARVPAPELLGFLYRGGWEGCCPAGLFPCAPASSTSSSTSMRPALWLTYGPVRALPHHSSAVYVGSPVLKSHTRCSFLPPHNQFFHQAILIYL